MIGGPPRSPPFPSRPLSRPEAGSALWIPHRHSEAWESAGGGGGKGVDVNGNLVERGKGDEFGIETPASSSTIACGQQKVKGGNGSSTASRSASSSEIGRASCRERV